MKCKGCGATYESQMEYCPYCGLENSRQKKRKEALAKRQARYDSRKSQVLEESASEIRLRKINRLMWIMAGLLGFVMILLIVYYSVEDKIWYRNERAQAVQLEQMREQEHWEAMLSYLYAHDTDSSEELYEYWQLAMMAEDGVDLRKYRDEYRTLDKEEYRAAFLGDASVDADDRDYLINHYSFLVERILQDCIDILTLREEYNGDSWRAEIYGPMTAEADRLLAEFEAEAMATLTVVFGLSQEEIGELQEIEYLYSEDSERYVERIKEGWLYE